MLKKWLFLFCLSPLLCSCDDDIGKVYGEPCPPDGGEMASQYKYDADVKQCESRHLCVGKGSNTYRCELGTECGPGQVKCGTKCVDPASNRDFCGAKGDCDDQGDQNTRGKACADTEMCVFGECKAECTVGQAFCEGLCIDPKSDTKFCGATGTTKSCGSFTECKNGRICSEGTCQCPTGHILCNSFCIDPKTNPDYCGATCEGDNVGAICNAKTQYCAEGVCANIECASGETICSDSQGAPVCQELKTQSTEHCGACFWDCDAHALANAKSNACLGGKCQYECVEGYTNCGTATQPRCIQTDSMQSNPHHCGSCNTVCTATQTCSAGACVDSTECESKPVCSANACSNSDTKCGASCLNCSTDQEATHGFCSSQNVCVLTECKAGYHLSDNKRACIQNSETSCAPRDSSLAVDCVSLKREGADGVDCDAQGLCVVKSCARGYILNVSKTQCVERKSSCYDVEALIQGDGASGRCIISECAKGYHIVKGEGGKSDRCMPNSTEECGASSASSTVSCNADETISEARCNANGQCIAVACANQEQCSDSPLREATACSAEGQCAQYRCAQGFEICAQNKVCLRLDGISAEECAACPDTCRDGQRCVKEGEVLVCK